MKIQRKVSRTLFSVFLLIALVALNAAAPMPAAAAPVNIPDAKLRRQIESALGKSAGAQISAADMATLTSLSASSSSSPDKISDLTGLEHATNLTLLSLSDNSISDISALRGLTNLTRLYLWDNSISDISALSGLTNLTRLYLSGNSVSDLSALSGLTKLEWLYLMDNSISDLSALSGLTKLRWLYLYNNSISDISPLRGLTNLTKLELSGNSISDISPLRGLTNLIMLSLYNNSISDISALRGLTKLTQLYLMDNSISDLSALSGLTKLTQLSLRGTSVSDLSTLSGLTKLTSLSLENNSVSDLSALSGLTKLEWLDLSGNPLNYRSIYTHIPALRNRGVDVSFINRVPQAPSKIAGDGQHGAPGAALTHPFVVEVRDAANNPFAGVPITFEITGGGTLSETATQTDAKGQAQTTLTLGATGGLTKVTASVRDAQTLIVPQMVTFTTTAGLDVDNDGDVDIADLVMVAIHFGQTIDNSVSPNPDVNRDGTVDDSDVLLVADMIRPPANLAPAQRQTGQTLTAATLQYLIHEAKRLNRSDADFHRGIRVLEELLASLLIPAESALFPNYPNPFNPETWIPYQLAQPASVTLTFYDVRGHVVRRLALGHHAAGTYRSKGRAAYWDGRNEVGESVASGVYFYTLVAGEFTATGKMLIRK